MNYDEGYEEDCGCKPGEPCEFCDWREEENEYPFSLQDEDYNPWERDNNEPELEGE